MQENKQTITITLTREVSANERITSAAEVRKHTAARLQRHDLVDQMRQALGFTQRHPLTVQSVDAYDTPIIVPDVALTVTVPGVLLTDGYVNDAINVYELRNHIHKYVEEKWGVPKRTLDITVESEGS